MWLRRHSFSSSGSSACPRPPWWWWRRRRGRTAACRRTSNGRRRRSRWVFLLLLLIESMHHHHARTILPDRSDQQHVSECVCMHTWTHVSNHSTLPMNQSIDQSTPSPSSSPPPTTRNQPHRSINQLPLPPPHPPPPPPPENAAPGVRLLLRAHGEGLLLPHRPVRRPAHQPPRSVGRSVVLGVTRLCRVVPCRVSGCRCACMQPC